MRLSPRSCTLTSLRAEEDYERGMKEREKRQGEKDEEGWTERKWGLRENKSKIRG